MRKLFWFGCAASVTAAAFVFVTARHAHKHPVSMVSHLVRGAYVAVGWSTPVLQSCRSLGAQMAFTVGRTLATEAVQTQTTREAAPRCTSKPQRCEPTTCEIPQVIDLAKFEQPAAPNTYLEHGPQYIPPSLDGELERELQLMEQQAAQTAPVTVVVTAGESEGEENEPVPATMPAAEDEEGAFQKLQDVEFWPEFTEVQQQETTEVEVLPMPHELEELPAATEQGDETDSAEQGEPPDCKETPEMDPHHSGCPGMGGCPYTGRCPPGGK